MTQTATQNEKGRNPGKSATPTTRENVNTQLVARRADGELIVDSLTIAREFDRRHDNVMRTLNSLIEDGTVDRLNFEEISYVDEMNRPQRAIQLTERAALVVMPFVGGRRAREGQVRLVDAFMALRERAARTALDLTNPDTLRTLLQSLAGQQLQLQQHVAELEPKAQAFERLGAADGSLCISDAAKSLNMQPKALFVWLAARLDLSPRRRVDRVPDRARSRGDGTPRDDDPPRRRHRQGHDAGARDGKGLTLLAKKLAEAA